MYKLGDFQPILSWLRTARNHFHLSQAGKVTLAALSGVAVGLFIFIAFVSYNVKVPTVSADNVTTSVYVLNTPPLWTVDAEEQTASATTTPTNAGSAVTWIATATDSNNDDYYLLICKTSATPTANSGAAPNCGGGISNQWAVSALTASAAQATVSTTTKETFPFQNESNDWYAWVCDANASLAQCNATYKQTNGTLSKASPFVVNHPPYFTAVANNSPVDPGGTITWTTTASDPDSLGGSDTIRLLVCKLNDFTGTACGPGGAWATSTLTASNPSTSTVITIPAQDKVYAAYVFVVDDNDLAATSSFQANNSQFTVNNVAPVVTQSSVTLVDPVHSSTTIQLSVPHSTSGPYWVTGQIVDNNSCLNSSSGNEISSISAAVYRSGIASTSCRVSGDYNSNNCYPQASPLTNFSCTQDTASCTGATDTNITFTCTFSLWYNADPTDAGAQYENQTWGAQVQATDDNALQSLFASSTSGSKVLESFLAFDVPETSIAYGGLQPSQQSPDPLSTTTSLLAYGNVGLDQTVHGDTMCPTWSSADSCDTNGVDPTNDIPVTNQKVATSSINYASSFAYALSGSTTPVSVGIHVPKTTSTSSPQSKNNYWGIAIPGTITVAGSYTGQNTITAVTSNSSNW